MVDLPSRFDLDMLLGREQAGQVLALFVGEQVGAGMQCPPRGVERVALAAPVTAGWLAGLGGGTDLMRRRPAVRRGRGP